ncbi:MAG TPA: hypothetical protein VE465_06415 [Streptosporangiaceae bacterium]|nr:hypothetical protein [Streptosporangiaceae bacterium]
MNSWAAQTVRLWEENPGVVYCLFQPAEAGKDFWRSAGVLTDSLGEYAKQLVKMPADRLRIDLEKVLAPAILSWQLTQTSSARQVTVGPGAARVQQSVSSRRRNG